MSNDLTPAEVRFVIALRGAGPLGTPPTGLARALGITPAAVGTLSYAIERKGYCTRERYGMRIFLRPTPQALALTEGGGQQPPDPAALMRSTPKRRAPRTPGG
jgi:DNA-binding MarR family transcriptional regulator